MENKPSWYRGLLEGFLGATADSWNKYLESSGLAAEIAKAQEEREAARRDVEARLQALSSTQFPKFTPPEEEKIKLNTITKYILPIATAIAAYNRPLVAEATKGIYGMFSEREKEKLERAKQAYESAVNEFLAKQKSDLAGLDVSREFYRDTSNYAGNILEKKYNPPIGAASNVVASAIASSRKEENPTSRVLSDFYDAYNKGDFKRAASALGALAIVSDLNNRHVGQNQVSQIDDKLRIINMLEQEKQDIEMQLRNKKLSPEERKILSDRLIAIKNYLEATWGEVMGVGRDNSGERGVSVIDWVLRNSVGGYTQGVSQQGGAGLGEKYPVNIDSMPKINVGSDGKIKNGINNIFSGVKFAK